MSGGQVHVAHTRLDALAPEAPACLSSSEVRRAERFKALRRRQQFLCGRALLRHVLERCTGAPAASHTIVTDANGKPHCVDGPAVSIAHSGNIVVCAVAKQGEIGIDIEASDRPRDIKGIADRYFSGDEAHWLATQADDRFYMLWVLKEAWLKATGSGLGGGLGRLRCIVIPPGIEAHLCDGEPPALRLYALQKAFIGLAMTTNVQKDVKIEYWDSRGSCLDVDTSLELIASTDSPRSSDPAANSLPSRKAPPHRQPS